MASTTWAQISNVASRAYRHRLVQVHVSASIPVQTGTSACHCQYTSTDWYKCMSLPVYQYRLVQVHVTTSTPVQTGTSACHYRDTSTDWYKCMSLPVHQYSLVQVHATTSIPVQTGTRFLPHWITEPVSAAHQIVMLNYLSYIPILSYSVTSFRDQTQSDHSFTQCLRLQSHLLLSNSNSIPSSPSLQKIHKNEKKSNKQKSNVF